MRDPLENKLRDVASRAGAEVLAAWFSVVTFRAAWLPVPELFATPLQKLVAQFCHDRGATFADSAYLKELDSHKDSKTLGGYTAFEDLISGTPAVTNPWHSLDRLRETQRHIALRRAALESIFNPETGGTLVGFQKRMSVALIESTSKDDITIFSMRDVVEMGAGTLSNVKAQIICSTGYELLDDVTGQLRREELWLVGAFRSFGKSAYAVFLNLLAASAGKRVLYVTAEDAPSLFGSRTICAVGKIDAQRFRDGRLAKDEYRKVADVRKRYEHDLKPAILDARGMPVEHIVGETQSIIAAEGIDLVLIDYVQAIDTKKNFGAQRELQVEYIGRQLTDAIKLSRTGGVLFSQLTDQPGSKGEAPDITAIRNSKSLINIADVVLIGAREKDNALSTEASVAYKRFFTAAKVKQGPAGSKIEIKFNPVSACFEPLYSLVREFNDSDEGKWYNDA